MQSFKQDNPNEYVNIKIQTCNELYVDYIDIVVKCNLSHCVQLKKKTDVITNITVLNIGANDIINSEVNKDLVVSAILLENVLRLV